MVYTKRSKLIFLPSFSRDARRGISMIRQQAYRGGRGDWWEASQDAAPRFSSRARGNVISRGGAPHHSTRKNLESVQKSAGVTSHAWQDRGGIPSFQDLVIKIDRLDRVQDSSVSPKWGRIRATSLCSVRSRGACRWIGGRDVDRPTSPSRGTRPRSTPSTRRRPRWTTCSREARPSRAAVSS